MTPLLDLENEPASTPEPAPVPDQFRWLRQHQQDTQIPRKDLDFFSANYLPLGGELNSLLAAGKVIKIAGERGTAFKIEIPASYAASCLDGKADLSLDGKPYDGAPVYLDRGSHKAAGKGCGRVKLLWERAARS